MLCVSDHHNDPATLQKWLENKTVEHFNAWLSAENNLCVVTEAGDGISGVGMVNRKGEIQLCYVSPESQRHGCGAAILRALERQASAWGVGKLNLASTVSARAFYEKHGYVRAGESTCALGLIRCYPYEKVLPSTD